MRKFLLFILSGTVLAACTSIDCPLDNVVVMTTTFYYPELEENNWQETQMQFLDTITVTSPSATTPLLNRGTSLASLELPMHQFASGSGRDTLALHFLGASGSEAIEYIYLEHTCTPHFEAIDCAASVFHRITAAECSTGGILDSIRIIQPLVNYDDVENLRLFFHPQE